MLFTLRMDEHRLWAACLYAIPGVGPRRYRELLTRYGHPRKVWEALEAGRLFDAGKHRQQGPIEPPALAELLKSTGWRIVLREEEGYPPLLRTVEDAPPLLYWKGKPWPGRTPGVAVVGPRQADGYSIALGERLGYVLARAGFAVVSGLARGVDLAAHRGALRAKGYTLGFLGQGLAHRLPPARARAAEEVALEGGLATEFAPHLPPLPGNFRARNRLIAASSIAVVVVSAARRSGALITAGQAGRYGREVFCLPHRIDSPLFEGVRGLLEDGARLVLSLERLVEELREIASGFGELDLPPPPRNPEEGPASRAPEERVLSALGPSPLWPEEIARETGLPLPCVLTALWELDRRGRALRLPGGAYVLAEPAGPETASSSAFPGARLSRL
jgi:DNA processing protein